VTSLDPDVTDLPVLVPDLPVRRAPCSRTGGIPIPCPWRRDQATPGSFPARLASADFADLCGTPGAEAPLGTPVMLCHKPAPGRPQLICAGWAVAHGYHHLGMRMALTYGLITREDLTPGVDWPPLYDTYTDMIAAQVHGAAVPTNEGSPPP
jgi:hypothetical protein